LLTVYYGFLAQGSLRPERGSNLLDGGTPWYATYPCADGKYIAVGALEDQFYDALIAGMGFTPDQVPDRKDARNHDRLRALFARRFLERTRDDWARVFQGTDACVSPVLSLSEAPHDPHQRARENVVDVAGILHPRPAPRFPSHPATPPRPPVRAGQDTQAILTAIGWSDDEIAKAFTSGAIAGDRPE
jgi:alpha-methylacyl-CoA racemase